MSIQVYNESLLEIPPNSLKDTHHYSGRILPELLYLQFKRPVKIMWYESLINVVHDFPNPMPPLDLNAVNKSDIDLILVLWCDHPWVTEHQKIRELVEQCSKPVLFLSWTPVVHDADHCLHYPFWVCTYPLSYNVRIPKLDVVKNSNRTYLFSSITARHQFDRTLNMIAMLMNEDLFRSDKSIVTYPAESHTTAGCCSQEQIVTRLTESWPAAADFFINTAVQKLPLVHPEMPVLDFGNPVHFDDTMTADVPAYTNAYINITAETSEYSPSLSEKSLKPILAGQLFVTVSPPGTLDMLQQLGFDIFDDIFEHTRYSEYNDVHLRIQALYDRLRTISTWDWARIYRETEERRINNRNWLLSGKIATHKKNQLAEMINGLI